MQVGNSEGADEAGRGAHRYVVRIVLNLEMDGEQMDGE